MAPVYDFRHVELDKIGRGKRIVKPPGGDCSNIFGPESAPVQEPSTPRKTNNYMQSTIFSPDAPDAPYQNGHPTTPVKSVDTQERLFGGSPEDDSPRKIVNRQRSSIFEPESSPSSLKGTPVTRKSINPITGEPIAMNGLGSPNGYHNGTNGTMNGHSNGYTNGHSSPESPMNGHVRVRNPPGGKCSGIF